jgi:hypothetical protein
MHALFENIIIITYYYLRIYITYYYINITIYRRFYLFVRNFYYIRS